MSYKEQLRLFDELKKMVLESLVLNLAEPQIIDRCSELLRHTKNDPSVLTLRAVAYRLLGNPKACVEDCNSILESDPNNRFALLHRASAHACCNLTSGSEMDTYAKDVTAAINFSKRVPNDRFALFTQLLLMGTQKESTSRLINLLSKILEENPEDRLTSLNLIAVYLVWIRFCGSQKEISETIRLAKKIMETDPHNALAAQVLLGFNGEEKYRRYPVPPMPPNSLFTSYPLLEQDMDLPEHLQSLEFPSTFPSPSISAYSTSATWVKPGR